MAGVFARGDAKEAIVQTIETSIDIAAPPHEVWRAISAFDHYKDWNPFITGIEGPAEAEAVITVHVLVLGGSNLEIPAKVVRFEPDRAVAWRSQLLTKGVFDREHIIEVEANATGSVVRNTQTLDGPLAGPMAMLGTPVIRRGLERMNDALKVRVEGGWDKA